VLRSALTLAVLTQQPLCVENVRAARTPPGLRPQHLTAVRAAAALCDARVEGAHIDSQALTFVPRTAAQAGTYTFDVSDAASGGSAGSVGLVLQTVLLPLALAPGPSRVTLRGGTHVPWAPSVAYLEAVYLPTLARMGVRATVNLARWGFYPAGGGEVTARIEGRAGALAPLDLTTRGAMERVAGRAVVTNLPAHIPQRMADRARNVLAEAGISARLEPRRLRGTGPGAGIFLHAVYTHTVAGFTAYGRRGLPAERVAEAACEDLLAYHRAEGAVDPHLADQLALPCALAGGASRLSVSRVTQHLLTNVAVICQFLDLQVDVAGALDTPGLLILEPAD
jgi:RNA 3'-terminal phosphate cyclase (ATP)